MNGMAQHIRKLAAEARCDDDGRAVDGHAQANRHRAVHDVALKVHQPAGQDSDLPERGLSVEFYVCAAFAAIVVEGAIRARGQ